jgi:uncharacterized phage protein gp47/JayE
MATNGVTPLGFVRPRLPEIRAEIAADVVARLQAMGYQGPIETRPDSLFGLLIDTFAERETAVWEQTEAVYYGMYPSSASGLQLDRAVSFAGVFRLRALQSSVDLVLYGAPGTVVPAGSQVRNPTTSTLWQLDTDVTIGVGAVADAMLRPLPAALTLYRVTIDGVDYTYASTAGTLSEVLAGLVAALMPSGHTISHDGAVLRIIASGETDFALQVSASIVITSFGSPVVASSVDTGAIGATPGQITEIVTLVPGWNAVTNLQDASLGRAVESDAALRERYKTGVYALGAATLPAIQANLESRVDGVQTVKVFENDTDLTDDIGRPPHSIHVVAQGGLDSEIAETIFQYKAAGIDTFGAIVRTVTDSIGVAHSIRFDRPTARYIWVQVQITLLPEAEEAFPADGFQQIAANILAAGSVLGIGQDVIWQRLLRAVHAVSGVAEAQLLLASSATPDAPGPFTESNVTIAAFQIARFAASRIVVT